MAAQDHIIFNHPHLGLADLEDVQVHARRHEVLIAHYLASAATLLPCNGGCIHLTLCGNQPRAWRVESHAERIGFRTSMTVRLMVSSLHPARRTVSS